MKTVKIDVPVNKLDIVKAVIDEKPLTDKQEAFLEVLKSAIANSDKSPTVRQLRDLMGHNSLATVSDMLKRLEKNGYIIRRNNKRKIILIDHK